MRLNKNLTIELAERVFFDRVKNDHSMDILIDHVGNSTTIPGSGNNLDRREHDILHYVESGKGIINCKGVNYSLVAGNIYLIPKKTDVSYYSDPQDPWKVHYISFYGSKRKYFLHQLGLSADNVALYTKPNKMILSCYQELLRQGQRENPSRTILAGIFYVIIGELLHSQAAKNDITVQIDLFQAITNHIYSHFDQNLRVSNIALTFNISQSQMYRIFKSECSLSPKQYIEIVKIEIACKLIRNGCNIKTTAFTCGYEYESHFYKTFCKHMGMTPVQYREKTVL